ncbi:MAG: hypothetical protein JJE21_01950 [Spirochaetaceae bacterium]|nr:hypothetical protein [Spirochaetaceae bacterium]
MKKVIVLILIVLFMVPIFSNDIVPLDELTRGVSAVIDTSYVAAAQFFAVDQSSIDSIVIRVPSGKILPDAIIVQEGDLGDYLQYFPQSASNFTNNTYGALNETVRKQLMQSDWKKGVAIVTGASAVVFQKDQNVFSLLTNALSGIFPRVGLVTDFFVEGTGFSVPLRIKGTFIVTGDSDGALKIQTISLTINDKKYDIE